MPNSETAKTKSGRKRLFFAAILAVVLAVGGLWAYRGSSEAARVLNVGTQQYRLEVVDTPDTRQQGLSGRETLAADRGMLFVFEHDYQWCFWMKDTHIPLDIIWLDTRRTVAHIEEHVAPETYPDSLCPSKDARYVIELNAGEAARAGIRQGDVLDF